MKKKIAILATHVGVINRGAETFVIELTKNLKPYFDIDVFSRGISDEIKENITTVSYKLPFWFNAHLNLYNKFSFYRKVCNRLYYPIPSEIEQYYFSGKVYKEYLSRSDYDLIYPNNGIWGVKAAVKMRKSRGTPFIYSGHGGNSTGEIKIMKCNPDKYIVLTEINKRWAGKFCNSVVKIYNGVCSDKFKNKTLIKPEHEKLQKPVILCSGAFNEMKRQKLLVDAFVLLEKGTLVLLGDGENKENIKKYCEEKIKDRYIIMSADYDNMPYYYGLCDIFSLPSKDEPFGIVYLEAMSSNKPIVTTDDESRREIIGDAGILTDVEDKVKYSEALKECYSRNWNNIPVNRAKNNFDWEIISKQYLALINQVLTDNLTTNSF